MIKIGRNDPCWCGSGKKYKHCHQAFDDRIMAEKAKGHVVPDHKLLKTPAQIEKIKESCKVNIAVLDFIAEHIREGITTEQIDKWVYEETTKRGAIPADLNYEGYPKSVCTSVNEQVCHGIPSPKVVLKDGDIVNVDCSSILDGYFSDSSRMFLIGNVSEEKKKLVEVTREAVYKGLEQVKPWGYLGDMAEAVNSHVKAHGYSVVREIGGHGVGLEFHEDPFVSHIGKRGTGMVLVPGMVITIEPMINIGKAGVVIDPYNEWTIYTKDGKDSAQWEHTLLITEGEPEVLSW